MRFCCFASYAQIKVPLRWQGLFQRFIIGGLQNIADAARLRRLNVLYAPFYFHQCFSSHAYSQKPQSSNQFRLSYAVRFADCTDIRADINSRVLFYFLFSHTECHSQLEPK
jgi:hypothetical protein